MTTEELDNVERDLYLRKVALGVIEKERVGYPSIEKPWLRYYSEEAIKTELPQCTVYEYLWENNKEHLNDIALNYWGTKITYKELFADIDKVSKAFWTQGIRVGDICTIVTLSCVTSILCFYALNKIGAVSNFVNVLSSEEELRKYFEEAESQIIVTLDLFEKKVITASSQKVKKIIVCSLADWMPLGIKIGFELKTKNKQKNYMKDKRILDWKKFIRLSRTTKKKISVHKNSKELCLLAHTGGTTGFPKSVLISDYSINAITCQYKLCIKPKRQNTFLNILPPFIVYGLVVCIHMPISLGLCTTIIPKFEAKEWGNYLTKYKPNYILGVPAYFAPLLSDKKLVNLNLSFAKAWGVGGDGMNEILEKDINQFLSNHHSDAKILKGYGMTEVCATAVVEHEGCNKAGSVGIPLVKNNVLIYDNENRRELKYREIGEVCLLCPSRMIKYNENGEETKNLIIRHLDGNDWIHTGDLGYIDEDGFLFITGRIKRFIMIVKDGTLYKIYPTQIEEVIREIDCIQDLCVVGVQNENGKVIKAYIVLQKGCLKQDIERKAKMLSEEKLPDYMQPSIYEFIDALPLTAAGKIDYKMLEKEKLFKE